ncbi:MAG: ATP-dependent protease ATPase subunit HslU [Clostridia bacterium]|nr:ATP-dependent protease ATPase subunit HslU [Clostridia bacterium]MDD4797965.1 ATP-dependent protease ATPase subunit HslU [Clostridia bacterium]
MKELTPRQIVAELDKYIIGQADAKRCVAVVLRNRYRRQQLDEAMQEDVQPKNVIMIGPTGVGKTEIARRLAKLVEAPFIKVEATKFTEVGYVGRDVESIIRDLVETSIRMVRGEKMEQMREKGAAAADLRLLNILAPLPSKNRKSSAGNPFSAFWGGNIDDNEDTEATNDYEKEKEKERELRQRRVRMRQSLANGELDNETVEIEVEESQAPIFGLGDGMDEMGMNMQGILGSIMPKKKKKRKVSIAEARKILTQEEAEKLIDTDEVNSLGIKRAEQSGIVFIDEIDKITGKDGGHGPDVSRGGVQRDILPIVEGCSVMTKYGLAKTDHILFIAAGAFHLSKPSDLIPELQGRFPLRVELDSLGENDLKRILLEPKNSLVKQYCELMEVDGVDLEFADSGISAIAEFADKVNRNTENIGARRLHTILEKVLEDYLFEAPEADFGKVVIDRELVECKLAEITQDYDLSRFIL